MSISSHDTVPLSYKLNRKVSAVMHCFYRNKIYFLLTLVKKSKKYRAFRGCVDMGNRYIS